MKAAFAKAAPAVAWRFISHPGAQRYPGQIVNGSTSTSHRISPLCSG